jgi:hypothetical protein
MVVTGIGLAAAIVAVVMVMRLVKVKVMSCFSFEGGFNTHSSEGTTGQDLFSPQLRFPGESVTKLYKKVTDERLLIEVEGMLQVYRSAVLRPMVMCGLSVETWVMLLAELLCLLSVTVVMHRNS